MELKQLREACFEKINLLTSSDEDKGKQMKVVHMVLRSCIQLENMSAVASTVDGKSSLKVTPSNKLASYELQKLAKRCPFICKQVDNDFHIVNNV